MTNGDRIRQMTDKELARIIMCPCNFTDAGIDCIPDRKEDCIPCCVKWLQEEMENDEF